jgi:hypothetical protein
MDYKEKESLNHRLFFIIFLSFLLIEFK